MTIRKHIYISAALPLLFFASQIFHTPAYSQTHAGNQPSDIDTKLIAACGNGDIKRAETLLRDGAKVTISHPDGTEEGNYIGKYVDKELEGKKKQPAHKAS